MQDHICMEGDIIPQVCQKLYCKKEYVSSASIAKHMKTSHFGSKRSVCQKCGEIIDLNEGTKKHMEKCSSDKSNRVGENIREKSKEVCKHWRRGRYKRGIQCNFSHVGRQDSISPNNQATQKATEDCHKGPSCLFLARGWCKFEHHVNKRHMNRNDQSRKAPVQRTVRTGKEAGGTPRQLQIWQRLR